MTENIPPKKTSQFKNCLFEAHKIQPEQFRLPDDGRKWKVNTFNRRTLFLELASFANGDGSSVRPSIPTLMERTGFCRTKIFNLLDDLKALGFWEKAGRHGWNGQTIRQLNMPDKPTETPSGSPSFENRTVVEVHDSKMGVRDSTLEVHDSRVEVHPRMDSTCHSNLPIDLPSKPAKAGAVRKTDELREGLAGEFCKARAGEKLNVSGFGTIQTLADEVGSDAVLAVWRRWLSHRDTGGLKLPLQMFAREFEATRKEMERDKASATKYASNKKREAESKAIYWEWRSSFDRLHREEFLAGCADIEDWQRKQDAWLQEHPPKLLLIAGEEGMYSVDDSKDCIDLARTVAKAHFDALETALEIERQRGHLW